MARNLVEQLRSKYSLGVSSGVVGLFGEIDDVRKFYKKVLGDDVSFGIEVIETRNRVIGGDDIVGYHGRMGNNAEEFSFYGEMCNQLLCPTKALVRELQGKDPYLLLHNNEVKEHKKTVFEGVNLVIENNPDENGVEKMIENVNKYSSVAVFDIVHALISGLSWTEINNKLEEIGQCLIHIPIGDEKSDSFDPREVERKTLERFGEVLTSNNCFPIIENQRLPVIDRFRSDPSRDKEFIRETDKKIRVLVEWGVILRGK